MKRWLIIRLYRLASMAREVFYRVWPGHTVGVQVLLVRGDEVLLVRHTYRGGWFFAGGGLKRGESTGQTAVRELYEELGAKAEDLRLFGIYTLRAHARTEQLFLFVAEQFEFVAKQDIYEIEEAHWFAVDALPSDIWVVNRQMLADYMAVRHTVWQPRLYS